MKLTQIAIVTALAGSLTIAQARDKGVGDGTLPEFLQQFDTNEDGKIDTEERQAIKELRDERRKERRDAIDTDGDGKISGEEKKAAHAAIRERIEERRAEHFAEIAGDDGLLTRAEFCAIPALADLSAEVADAMYARLDADESGDVTLEEFNSRLRRHHHGPKPGPKPGPEGPKPKPEGPKPGPEGPKPGPEGPKPRPEGPKPGPEGPKPGPEGPRPGPGGEKPPARK